MSARKDKPKKVNIPITTHFILSRQCSSWDWPEHEDATWDDVGARSSRQEFGPFDRIDELLAFIKRDNVDALYVWHCIEHPLPDGSEFASAELFEGRFV